MTAMAVRKNEGGFPCGSISVTRSIWQLSNCWKSSLTTGKHSISPMQSFSTILTLPDDPQPVRAAAPPIDRAAIEAIVREILLQETRHSEKPAGAPVACPAAETTTAPSPQERTPEPEYVSELGEAVEADDAILGLISSTMEAFRQGR